MDVDRSHQRLTELRHDGDVRNHCLAPEHILQCKSVKDELVTFAVFPCLDPAYPFMWDTLENAYKACIQLAEAVAYIHENGISHRDIIVDNILSNLNGVNNGLWNPGSDLYLIDWEFASSRLLEAGPPCPDYNEEYCAPEVHKKEPHNPQMADVWQLGRVFIEGLSSLPCSAEGSSTMLSLCEKMTNEDPGQRPTAQQVVDAIHRLRTQQGQLSDSVSLLPYRSVDCPVRLAGLKQIQWGVLAAAAVVLLCISLERWRQ